jgi:hypothetical protein
MKRAMPPKNTRTSEAPFEGPPDERGFSLSKKGEAARRTLPPLQSAPGPGRASEMRLSDAQPALNHAIGVPRAFAYSLSGPQCYYRGDGHPDRKIEGATAVGRTTGPVIYCDESNEEKPPNESFHLSFPQGAGGLNGTFDLGRTLFIIFRVGLRTDNYRYL